MPNAAISKVMLINGKIRFGILGFWDFFFYLLEMMNIYKLYFCKFCKLLEN